MKFYIEKYRIAVSRIVAAIILFFVFATQSKWETTNEKVTFVLFLAGIILVAVASLGRMWCSLYIAGYKDTQLITKGPYSTCRYPLYFFSLIGVMGIGFCTETLTFPIVFTIIFVSYYWFVIRSEETRLRGLFGSEYEEYRKKVPAFFPRISILVEPAHYTVNPTIYRQHIFSALWFIWVVGILEVIEGVKEIGIISTAWSIY
ncbi:MAG: isoprenylcysteine carboxylmethyltransferase family protein [Syntrophales bacterium]|jgi:protein-S-isoprenylcysteine O-methyltransferase Ste14|nr:isoprenylcysteine carboxylmethyltransferase family protein [Syntrophales bacterium]